MSKEITYNLEYREKGEKKSIQLKIDFVSFWCIRESGKIDAIARDVQTKWNEIQLLQHEIELLDRDKPEEYQKAIDRFTKDTKKLIKNISEYKDTDVLERRFEIIKTILEDNGIKDEKLLTFKFWDRQVDPAMTIDFIRQCLDKDFDKKKVM